MSNCKGAAFRELVRWYGQHLGATTLHQRLGRLPALLKKDLVESDPHLGLLASRWYPVTFVHPLLDALTHGLSVDDRRAIARQGSDAVMSATLKGIYRTLFSTFATPRIYARLSGTLWRSYYDSGDFSVHLERDDEAHCTIKGWTGHHPFMCELNWGAATAIYSHMGLQQVVTERSRCVDERADGCTFVTRWRGA